MGFDEVTILCIDQHAADERVRLENLQDEILGDRINAVLGLPPSASAKFTKIVCPSRRIEVGSKEKDYLLSYRSWTSRFGWTYEIEETIRRR